MILSRIAVAAFLTASTISGGSMGVASPRGEGGRETTRFALFTAISLFGVMAPGSVAGYLLKIPALIFPELDQLACYRIFFLWVMVCTIPSFLVTALMAKPLCDGFTPPETRN